ncbi:hypothetical protein C8Q70DRAFT_679870 [Cubamyces menziesii]|nr:hypothetical protein C8Q70DRAFT_679870 [Cubamyces menziesii]
MDIASATLFYYEYILTIPDEVRLFWQHPRSLATVLYLLIRYASLVTNTARLVFSAPEYLYPKVRLTATGCQTLQDIVEIAQLISTAAGSAFIALRIMAVWSRNWYLGSILFVLGLINSTPLAQTLFFAFSGSVQAPPYSACSEGTESPTMALVVTLYVPLVASATNMAYELLCFVLVVSKTYRGYRVPHGSKTQPQLTYLLIRDGSLYFA